MPKYSYTVKDLEERTLRGTLDGANRDEVLDILTSKDFMPIAIDELNFDGTPKARSFAEKFQEGMQKRKGKVPYKAVVFFTRQLATMVQEGVPLARALEQLAKDEGPAFKKAIQRVGADIANGYTFADAVAKHPNAFNGMYVSVCRAGEATGALDKVLGELADYMENIEAMRTKVKGAMRYPIFIAVFISLMMLGILWKLVPAFENVYSALNADLPLPTMLLIGASRLIRGNFLLFIAALIGLVVLWKYLMTREDFELQVHKHILKLPIFGPIMRKNILGRFCRTMALLMQSGTPILRAVEMAAGVVGNKMYVQKINDIYNSLKQGELLSASMENTGVFPVLVTQLVGTGEMSGKVDDLLRKAAEFYEREIRVTVDSLASLIEPILIVVLGVIVGGILISLYLPVFMIGQHIG